MKTQPPPHHTLPALVCPSGRSLPGDRARVCLSLLSQGMETFPAWLHQAVSRAGSAPSALHIARYRVEAGGVGGHPKCDRTGWLG